MARIVTEYKLPNWNAFVWYNGHEDMYKRPPKEIAQGLEHVAHIMYRNGGFKKSFDMYRIRDLTPSQDRSMQRIKIVRMPNTDRAVDLEEIDVKNAVRYEFKSTISPEDICAIQDAARDDIQKYTQGRGAKESVPTEVRLSPLIVPRTILTRVQRDTILEDGKQEFIPYCSLDTNLDFTNGCIAEFLPGPRANFDGTTFTDYWQDLSSACEYCYALRQHQFFPKSFLNLDPAQLEHELRTWFEGKKAKPEAKVLRLGKQTETGSIFTESELEQTLAVATKVGTKVVMPTKFLRYTPHIAKAFKENNGVILYSMFDDNVEQGPRQHGCDNDFRMEQALLYKQAGVNVGFFLMLDPVPHPHESPHLKETLRVYDFAVKHGIQPQLLPIHLPSKKLAHKVMGGHTWDHLKHPEGQHTLDGNITSGGYEKLGNSHLYAARINPFWEQLVGDNKGFVRMCHHNSEKTWCGDCLLSPGCVGPTQEVEIDYSIKKPNGNYRPKPKGLLPPHVDHPDLFNPHDNPDA